MRKLAQLLGFGRDHRRLSLRLKGNESRSLTRFERLSFFASASSVIVAAASFAVALRSAEEAKANTDIRHAISNLSTLATQTKRQADYSLKQVAILQSQADEAKSQTRAISAQTDAITGSSNATIKAAEAQRVVAVDSANASRPRFSLRSFDLTDLRQDVSKIDVVSLTGVYTFRNTGSLPATIKEVRYWVSFGIAKIDTSYPASITHGNDMVVTSALDSGLSNTPPIPLRMPKATFVAFREGKVNGLFYGEIEFNDIGGQPHTQCFSFVIFNGQPDLGILFKPADTIGLKCS